MITIKPVTVDEILPLRHKVMWPNKPIDFCKLPEDANGFHYGLFLEGRLISCISAFIDVTPNEAQFRKFATDQDYQHLGYGTLLLQSLMGEMKRKSVGLLWCNARVTALGFYGKFGFVTEGRSFEKDGMQYIRMQRELNSFCATLSPIPFFS